ncbi:HIT family protein [Candidatus Woesearchaeota archaeon]|nr:HIT family protein [Candidatus Woesearchaeota archaeon]
MKAQLEEQKKNCIFCQIISGQQEAKKIYEDEEIYSVLDIRPVVKGHLLVMPKEHYPIMPLLPPKTFQHMFGILPQIVEAQKKAMVMTGCTVFIANGGVAGQQAPHFIFHVLGRDKSDGILNYYFEPKKLVHEDLKKAEELMKHNLPRMLANIGAKPIETDGVYEDDKIKIMMSPRAQAVGHLEIYSKEEPKYFEKLPFESAAHLFYAASFAATALFEGLGAHGTNIIMQTGESADNPEGKLVVHVLPRYDGDGLNLIIPPSTQQFDTDTIVAAYANEMYKVGKKEEPSPESQPKSAEAKGLEEVSEAIKKIRRMP